MQRGCRWESEEERRVSWKKNLNIPEREKEKKKLIRKLFKSNSYFSSSSLLSHARNTNQEAMAPSEDIKKGRSLGRNSRRVAGHNFPP